MQVTPINTSRSNLFQIFIGSLDLAYLKLLRDKAPFLSARALSPLKKQRLRYFYPVYRTVSMDKAKKKRKASAHPHTHPIEYDLYHYSKTNFQAIAVHGSQHNIQERPPFFNAYSLCSRDSY
jgi:hypothetical protein